MRARSSRRERPRVRRLINSLFLPALPRQAEGLLSVLWLNRREMKLIEKPAALGYQGLAYFYTTSKVGVMSGWATNRPKWAFP